MVFLFKFGAGTLLVLVMAIAQSAHGQTPAPEACDTCTDIAHGQVYTIQSVRSRVLFRFTSLSAFSLTGVARNTRGRIVYYPDRPEDSEVNVRLMTEDIDMNNPVYNRLVRSEPFLNTSRYPEISFISKNIRINDNNEWIINGILSLRGISQDETLVARLNREDEANDVLEFSATTSILRSEYGMKSLRLLLSDNIDFNIEVIGIPAAPPMQ